MRARHLILFAALFTAGCAPTGTATGEPVGTTNPPRVEPSISAPGTIDNAQALKIVLEQVGITDVHPVAGKSGDPIAAWAVIPAAKKCPMFFTVMNGNSFAVTHLHKPGGTIVPMDMEGYAISPSAADLANWAANNLMTAASCAGNEAPAADAWPTSRP